MRINEIKGHLIASRGNLQTELQERRKTVVMIEADLVRARREADVTFGALKATEQALAAVDSALATPPAADRAP